MKLDDLIQNVYDDISHDLNNSYINLDLLRENLMLILRFKYLYINKNDNNKEKLEE